MNRRELMLVLGGAMTAASALRAQQPKIPRVGILTAEESERVAKFDAFREGLRGLGYVEGRNIILEFRLASGNLSLFSQLAAELAALPVDVIVTEGLIEAVVAVSGHIPINGKRLDLLRAAFPHITAVTALVDPSNPVHKLAFEQTETAARSMGLGSVSRVEAGSSAALRALRPTVFSGASAVVVIPDGMFYSYRRDIVALVNAARPPAIYPEREYADDGGLMSYGANVPDNFRRAASYVDRILKGASPADLPIQEPVRFDFVINLKTAAALGLTVPPSILARADEVIE